MLGPTLILSALLAQTQPAAAAQAEKDRAENRQAMQQEFDALRSRPAQPIDKTIKITLERGHLHVIPLTGRTDGFIECDAPSWPGRMEIQVGDDNRIHLKHMRLTDGDSTLTMTEVLTGPDYLQINRSSESPTGLISVTLLQSRQFADEEDHNPTRLTVQQTSEDAATDPPQTRISAESFARLRQEHPAEVRTYLLPILRDLGASRLLLAADPASAWQVLGKEIPVDPQLDQKLNDALKKLDADDFATRAKAEENLDALGPPAAAALEKRELTALSFDARAAVDNFLHTVHPLTAAEAQAAAESPNFMLDTVLLNEPKLRPAALERIAKLTGHTLSLPPDASAADREKRVEAFRQRYVPAAATLP